MLGSFTQQVSWCVPVVWVGSQMGLQMQRQPPLRDRGLMQGL